MIEFFRKIPLFENLSENELEKIQRIARTETAAQKTVLFKEGDP